MKRAFDRISSLAGENTTSPDVLRSVQKMIQEGTIEPAIARSVAVGLQMALDILKEEATNESPGTS